MAIAPLILLPAIAREIIEYEILKIYANGEGTTEYGLVHGVSQTHALFNTWQAANVERIANGQLKCKRKVFAKILKPII